MSSNIYAQFLALFPDAPLLVGTVTAVQSDGCIVTLPDGGIIKARGTAAIDDQVYVRDGVIEGLAPSLPVYYIEV